MGFKNKGPAYSYLYHGNQEVDNESAIISIERARACIDNSDDN